MSKLRRGFTLIEVILATILFAVAAVGFVQTAFYIHRALEQIESQDSREADIRFVRQTVLAIEQRKILEEGDEMNTLNSGVAMWEVEIEETTVPDLFKVILTIAFDGDSNSGEPHIDELYIFRKGSDWSQPVDRGTLLEENRERILEGREGVL